jgi:RimJ/RimL family protein N-acetyltransferase
VASPVVLAPVTLTGTHVRLEPLTLDHVDRLALAAAEDRANYQWTPVPDGVDATRAYIRGALADPLALAFATTRADSGAVVGATRFLDAQRWMGSPRDDGTPDSVEIGATWLAASAQRTAVNTEAKLLMLDHAFMQWRVARVTFNTDERNLRSRDAIARLGATFEGILHGYRYGVDGPPRNTATFSITAAAWPAVRAGLIAKLARR